MFAHQAHKEEERLVPEVTRHGGFLDPLRVHVPMDASFFHIDHHLQHILARLEEREGLIVPLPVEAEVAFFIGETTPQGNTTSLVYISTHALISSLLSSEPNSHFIIPSAIVVHYSRYTPHT